MTNNLISRTNRTTGATIVAVDTFNDGDWATCCETHGAFASMPNKTTAISWMAEPWVFCEGCADVRNAKVGA